ncbi:hypothetical protein HYR99_09140 [Candidatus Poribacteria bacterium]|nr:hypothetical protein [Candidatus Poribacteria bacterium]
MRDFEAYFSPEKIVKILCKIRVSDATKRHDKQFYRNISSKASSPDSVKSSFDGKNLLPPRRKWFRPRLEERRNKSVFDINLCALEKTVLHKMKYGIDQSEDWHKNLKAFIHTVTTWALQNTDYQISEPCIHPKEKDPSKKTYRPLAVYKLEDRQGD